MVVAGTDRRAAAGGQRRHIRHPLAILGPGLISQAAANGINIGADVGWLSPLFS